MIGYFKFHRQLFEKPIWTTSTPEQKTILITLMGMVNFKANEWEFKGEKFIVHPGQCITSLESIAEKSGKGVTIQNVRTAIKRFEKYGFLTSESTNKNRLITVVNWGFYQGDEDEVNKQTNKHLTSNQQATNKQLTTNKESNKIKKDKKDNTLNPSSPKYEICDLDLAKYFFTLILENNENAKPPNFETWAKEIRLMRERDNRPLDHIKYLMDWVQQDNFWQSNILSPGKLREKYDQLVLRCKADHEQKKKRTGRLDKPRAFSSLEEWAEGEQ